MNYYCAEEIIKLGIKHRVPSLMLTAQPLDCNTTRAHPPIIAYANLPAYDMPDAIIESEDSGSQGIELCAPMRAIIDMQLICAHGKPASAREEDK